MIHRLCIAGVSPEPGLVRAPDDEYVPLTDEQVETFTTLNLIHVDEVDDDEDDEAEVGVLTYAINYDVQQGHEPLTPDDLDRLAAYLTRSPSTEYTDAEALDRLNYMLSAPEWSVSFLEDACEIVRATGRPEIRGAQWASH
jgi:hypothetical protein